MSELRDYRAVLHVHTVYSKRRRVTPAVVAAAQEARVDVLLITDHNSLALRRDGWQRWHGSTLVLVGDEVSPVGRGHVLALGLEDTGGMRYLPEPAYLRHIARQGGLAILAHPYGKADIGRGTTSSPWIHWQDPHYSALEIWTYMHDWIEGLRWWQWPGACLRPHRRIRGPDRRLLRLWDQLLRERNVTGVAALDAHAVQVLVGKLGVFPYGDLFRSTLTHLLAPPLSGEADRDERTVLEAIRLGRAYMAFEIPAPVDTFTFVAERASERWLPISRLPAGAKTTLLVETPGPAEIRLVHDSSVRESTTSKEASWQVAEPGVYRVEVYLNQRPWIFSNPICLT